MQLARFLNSTFKTDGFILIDAYSKKYIIGSPKNKTPIILKILNKKLHYKLLFRPDLYFGEAYSDGDIIIENGTLTDFLDLALMNVGRKEINSFIQFINKWKEGYDLVYGIVKSRQEGRIQNFFRSIFYKVINLNSEFRIQNYEL